MPGSTTARSISATRSRPVGPGRRAVVGLALLGLALAGCTSASPAAVDAGAAASAPGKDAAAVGFIAVGPADDFGYNQAVADGVAAVKKAFPDVKVLTAYNIPEDDTAATTMESMVDQGAKVLFATSYGHLDAARKVARAHPDVVVVHQGGLLGKDDPKNLGTYFGAVYEPVYLAGIAAGAATKTNKLGFVYAIPIPQTLANINAFTLGAQSVNPKVTTTAVSTTSWCDPGVQADRVQSLLSSGVDVITNHQDCTKTIIEATEAAGKFSVGYHADASSLAPKGWLAGSQWKWADLYDDIVKTARSGEFVGSRYQANYRGNTAKKDNPFVASPIGPSVSPETKALMAAAQAKLEKGWTPFTGPLTKQNGTPAAADGQALGVEQVESMNWFVKGVIGSIS